MMTKSVYLPGQIIPVPPDFSVEWENPTEAHQLWQLERMHFDAPLLPLAAAVWQTTGSTAFNRVAEQYRLPIRLYFWPVKGYLYANYRSVGLPPNWVLRGLNWLESIIPVLVKGLKGKIGKRVAKQYLDQIEPVMLSLSTQWQHNWRPELEEHLGWWQAYHLDEATLPDLLTHLHHSLERIQRVWEIHFQLLVPCLLALHQFETLYRDCFPEAKALAAFRLLQGYDNSFLQAERALWELGRQAYTLTAVRQIITEHPLGAVLTDLSQCPEGQLFLAEWQAFLTQYGRRGHKVDGLDEVSWLEDPTPVLQTLKQLLTEPDRDTKAVLQWQAAERETLIHQTRQRLQNHPARERFEQLLRAAQTAAYLHEEHNFWIDQQAMYELRQVFLAIGRRLAQADVISQATDIFYLLPAEILTIAQALPTFKQHTLVVERKQILAHAATLSPPATIGTMPLMLPPENDPLSNAFGKVIGDLIPKPPSVPASSQCLQGLAASSGIVRGTARIIHTLAEADQLQVNDILVTVATLPPWTPLFGRVAAVITESGGILSHAAVIAREYGLPAVVAVQGATTLLQNGQLLEVDGGRGTIRIISKK